MRGPLLAALLLPLLPATAGSPEDRDRDPCTRGEPEALAAAGHTSLGFFPLGDPGVLRCNVHFATVLDRIDGDRRFDVPSMPVW